MSMINTHGLKIDLESLESVSRATEDLNYKLHQEIFFDMETGEVMYNCNLSDNWVEHHDPAVIKVADTRRHHTAQWIADKIASDVQEIKRYCDDIGHTFDWPVIHQ